MVSLNFLLLVPKLGFRQTISILINYAAEDYSTMFTLRIDHGESPELSLPARGLVDEDDEGDV